MVIHQKKSAKTFIVGMVGDALVVIISVLHDKHVQKFYINFMSKHFMDLIRDLKFWWF